MSIGKGMWKETQFLSEWWCAMLCLVWPGTVQPIMSTHGSTSIAFYDRWRRTSLGTGQGESIFKMAFKFIKAIVGVRVKLVTLLLGLSTCESLIGSHFSNVHSSVIIRSWWLGSLTNGCSPASRALWSKRIIREQPRNPQMSWENTPEDCSWLPRLWRVGSSTAFPFLGFETMYSKGFFVVCLFLLLQASVNHFQFNCHREHSSCGERTAMDKTTMTGSKHKL